MGRMGKTGERKRDIKVKALEAAEAAKRREQDKDNERKMKKEALKLERERMEKENAKERVLNLIKKKEELKKKEADIAARKRLREEEERKQVAKKRKLVADAQKNQIIKLEKTRGGKVDIQKNAKNTATAGNTKKSETLRRNKNADENSVQKHDTELRTDKTLANVAQQVDSVLENRDASNDFDEKEKATNIHEKSPVNVGPGKLTSQENSYDISPYQCSDDEDDEEDDQRPIKKFVPSWASKKRVAIVLPLQQKLNPESIFSADSFCSMDEGNYTIFFFLLLTDVLISHK
ncbi:putative inner centromere ARK-binding protein [Helianthus anomalus]